MSKIGIDAISFYSSHYYLNLDELARARGIEPEKYSKGLGQKRMGVAAPGEDIVTLGANAAKQALAKADATDIDTVLFATESGIDQSKAAGTYLHSLLNLPKNCRVVELKQACYSATAALQMAIGLVLRNPRNKVLVVASDIARYGLNTPGEPTQGCGAVAFIVSTNPRIISIGEYSGLYSEDVMDFWRPNYRDEALVDGKFSAIIYLKSLKESWLNYQAKSGLNYDDHAFYCYHTPLSKLVEKANKKLADINKIKLTADELLAKTKDSLCYSKEIGNSYAAALYISLASLLDNSTHDLTDKRIGLYSYGSGCVAEFFGGTIEPNYKAALDTAHHANFLQNRQSLTYAEYEEFYNFTLPTDGSNFETPAYDTGDFKLVGIANHKRIYQSET
jgi:hydroxymethylglutaryl-CoA synthase